METEWSLFWCSIYRGPLMYLLRAGKEAAMGARLLPQRNSSIPCPTLAVGAVAEPSPGTALLHTAAGPLLPA